jgi:predicted XRE-type DNA-binding protein
MPSANKPSHISRGSVFDDLGLSRTEATEAKVKADLWRDLIGHIAPLDLTQKELARRLNVHQPEVSHLLSGKLSKFSVGSLIAYAVKLDLAVKVKITAPAKVKNRVVKVVRAGAKAVSSHV